MTKEFEFYFFSQLSSPPTFSTHCCILGHTIDKYYKIYMVFPLVFGSKNDDLINIKDKPVRPSMLLIKQV